MDFRQSRSQTAGIESSPQDDSLGLAARRASLPPPLHALEFWGSGWARSAGHPSGRPNAEGGGSMLYFSSRVSRSGGDWRHAGTQVPCGSLEAALACKMYLNIWASPSHVPLPPTKVEECD